MLTICSQDMENLSTDNLMRLQVEQLEKEKKELNERMRVAAKRLDHVERAYRKEERPLLAKDYEFQQANDTAAFEAFQKTRLESHRLAHQHDLETKRRLSRMMDDYLARREAIMGKRGEEFAKRKEQAQKKINDEKTKRRHAVLSAREEERLRREEEESLRREKEEEEARRNAGSYTLCSYFILILTSPILQSVLRRRSAVQQRKLLRLQRQKLRSVKKRKSERSSADNVRRNALPCWKKRACNNNEKRRPSPTLPLALPSVQSHRSRPLCVRRPTVTQLLGDDRLRAVQPHRHLLARLWLLHLGLKVLLPSSAQVSSRADGEPEKQPRKKPKVEVLLLLVPPLQ